MLNLKQKKIKQNLPELFTQILHSFNDADAFKSNQAPRYMEAWNYYLAKLPMNPVKNGSSYVEPVLRDAVDQLQPSLMNIFTASESNAVRFCPTAPVLDVQGQPVNPSLLADAINSYMSTAYLRENNGYQTLSNAITEVLVSGHAYIKEFIDEERVEDCVEYEDWVPQEVVTMAIQEFPHSNLDSLETKTETIEVPQPMAVGDMPKTVEKERVYKKGKLELLRIERKVKIDYIPFNDVFVDPATLTLEDARYFCHRQIYTVGQLLDMGFDEDLVTVADSADEANNELGKKRINVDGTFSDDKANEESHIVDPMERKVYLYEHYIYSSLLEGETKFYKVFATHNDILEVHYAKKIPFQCGQMKPMPGSFIGNSLHDYCKAYQDSLSHLERVGTENYTNATHPKRYGVKGAYDKRSAMENRPGGIIEINTVGALVKEAPDLLPQSFDASVMRIQASRDRTIGAQAGNTIDGGSLTNVAASTVNMILSNEELKNKVIAGNIARTLVRPMFETIYNLYKDEDLFIQVGNQQVKTSSLPSVSSFIIDVTTSNDYAKMSGVLLNLIQLDIQAAQAPSSTLDRYSVMVEVAKSAGLTEDQVAKFIPAPQPPTPEQQAKAAEAEEMDRIGKMEALDKMKAENAKMAAEVAKMEQETAEMIKDKAAERKRAEEESVREFMRLENEKLALELKLEELRMEKELMAKEGKYVNVVVD